MGLTKGSADLGELRIRRKHENDLVVALAGNPNVGKSTVFNGLTGMHQHTGNWPGKTVANAQGYVQGSHRGYVLVDLPGTYSLLAHSAEEEVARDYLCFGAADRVVVVCDATCLERNLHLVLQILEARSDVLVAVNLMDEAKRKGITPDLALLQERLGIPVLGLVAQKKKSLAALPALLDTYVPPSSLAKVPPIHYPPPIEAALADLIPLLQAHTTERQSPRWLALKLLEGDTSLLGELQWQLGEEVLSSPTLVTALDTARERLKTEGFPPETLADTLATATTLAAETICKDVVCENASSHSKRDRWIDRLLTGKYTAYPLMLLLLLAVFWITIRFANIPSAFLSQCFEGLLEWLTRLLIHLQAPEWLMGLLIDGLLRVPLWVISVMLPPMAIFFPLFTFLEDVGYLPRIAYNLDRPFHACRACGKQSLTMCMGFGCNAAGVVGCRIIDSPRERMLAILTNSFVPCNGRFPALISLISIFLVGSGAFSGALAPLLLTLCILLGVLMTMAMTKLLAHTVLRGAPSSFALELPPFRRPQLGRLILRSLLDRTLFVLGRSVTVAIPAGLLIWLMTNLTIGEMSLLHHCADLLDPFARLFGMDGVILLAFVLGLPANEIILPIITTTYLCEGTLMECESLLEMQTLLSANGWTWATAVSVILFLLFHWPCSTTLLTVKKETGKWRWSLLAAVLPTVVGLLLCLLFTQSLRLLQQI
ncbi:MAG: ferrous iron transport protein B [Clostridia bacterium]|nr:ferrous iron transport protein B [Clostridia bacterium]